MASSPLKSNLGDFLRNARLGAELSQADVAKAFKLSTPQCVSNWETGRTSPPMKYLPRLCKMYGVSAEVLFDLLVDYSVEQTKMKIRDEFERVRKRSTRDS